MHHIPIDNLLAVAANAYGIIGNLLI